MPSPSKDELLQSALYHIEHGGLPPNKFARDLYYSLMDGEVSHLSLEVTPEDRAQAHLVAKIIISKGGSLR